MNTLKEEKLIKKQNPSDMYQRIDRLWKQPERKFAQIMNLVTSGIEISYACPEELIVMQNEQFDGFIYFVYKGKFIV
jgi:hypothetical protein